MPDPIASTTNTVVVGDPEHVLSLHVVPPVEDPQLVVKMSLAVRTPSQKVIDRIEGSFNLTDAVTQGLVAQADVDAMRRVLVALGQKLALDAGMTVTAPA